MHDLTVQAKLHRHKCGQSGLKRLKSMDKKPFLEAGKVINTHGVKGEMKIMSLCDSPCDFLKIDKFFWDDKGTQPINVISKRLHGEFPLILAEGISTVQDATLKKNKFIYAARESIPCEEGHHFIQDILGLPVIHAESGKILGKISDVLQNTAQTVYEIETESGKVYVPGVPAFIVKIDTDSGVYIDPIEGMFDKGAYEV